MTYHVPLVDMVPPAGTFAATAGPAVSAVAEFMWAYCDANFLLAPASVSGSANAADNQFRNELDR